ncbi:UNVERIFIED_CONTAM: hypothetical protein K2H54_034815 [Gekko kuhli]
MLSTALHPRPHRLARCAGRQRRSPCCPGRPGPRQCWPGQQHRHQRGALTCVLRLEPVVTPLAQLDPAPSPISVNTLTRSTEETSLTAD